MSGLEVILAAADLRDEAALVSAAREQGITVVRRSVDAADLLAAAAADPSLSIVLTPGMPRLTGELAARLLGEGRTVVGVAAGDDDEQRLRHWRIDRIVKHAGDAPSTMRAVALALASVDGAAGGVWSLEAPCFEAPPIPGPGLLVAVWGPTGAPGRTTTAIALAEALAAGGRRTCIVDADPNAPALAAQLGMLDDGGGLALACRHADNATLNERSLSQCARMVLPGLSVLTAVAHPDHWPEVRESAVRMVWEQARAVFDAIVVDAGSTAPEDDAMVSGSTMLAVRRDAAASTALRMADRIVVAARPTMMGMVRLLNELPALPQAASAIVLTGGAPRDGSHREIERILRTSGVTAPSFPLPRSARSLERAVREGVLPRECASRRERRQLDEIVRQILDDERPMVRVRAGRPRGRRR